MPFRDLIGHSHVRSRLARAVARGTLPPSLIFAGPEGVGKRQTAIALAQALNCLEPIDTPDGRDACGRCATCTRIARGLHTDVTVVGPNDNGSIVVDAVREAIESAAFRPFEGRWRVTIIDPADAMGDPAQNALLKTLEEPATASIFVLVTPRPDALLPTVLSRCPRLRFGPFSAEEVAAFLVERHGYTEGRARAAAAIAGGSLSVALEASDAEQAEARAVASELLRGLAPQPPASRRLALAQVLVARVVQKSRKASRASDRELVDERLQSLGSMLRDIGVATSGGDTRWLANGDLSALIAQASRGFDRERLIRAYRAVDEGRTALEQNVNPKAVADWVLCNI
jgi:DNA polymerase III subunit delta'